MSNQNTMTPQTGQTPAAHTAAVMLLAAPTDNSRWTVHSLSWSYSTTPTGGSITIAWNDGSARTMVFYITAGGPGQLQFIDDPLVFPPNTAVTITLADGGAAVTGALYGSARTY